MAFPGEPGAVHMAVSPAPRATRGLPAGLGPPRTLVATCHAACWSPEPLDRAVRSGSTSFLQSRGDGAVQTLAVLGRWPTSLPVLLPPRPPPMWWVWHNDRAGDVSASALSAHCGRNHVLPYATASLGRHPFIPQICVSALLQREAMTVLHSFPAVLVFGAGFIEA